MGAYSEQEVLKKQGGSRLNSEELGLAGMSAHKDAYI